MAKWEWYIYIYIYIYYFYLGKNLKVVTIPNSNQTKNWFHINWLTNRANPLCNLLPVIGPEICELPLTVVWSLDSDLGLLSEQGKDCFIGNVFIPRRCPFVLTLLALTAWLVPKSPNKNIELVKIHFTLAKPVTSSVTETKNRMAHIFRNPNLVSPIKKKKY